MPRSRSRLMESMARSWGISAPHCRRRRSMRVVLPWSTCAITATLRSRLGSSAPIGDTAADEADAEAEEEEKARRKREWRLSGGGGEERDLRVVDQSERSNEPAISFNRNGRVACVCSSSSIKLLGCGCCTVLHLLAVSDRV